MAYKNRRTKQYPGSKERIKFQARCVMRRIFDFPRRCRRRFCARRCRMRAFSASIRAKAAKLPGVRAIITGADIAGVMVGLRMKDMPLLAHDRVRYVGEPVAAVAADNDEIAEEALNLIDVQYEELPFVTDPVEAIRPGAPVLHDNPARL